ncbi:MFS transporter [Oceanibaculum nanhaiense]|uniref:MFS transporter n=1 Tax=Oceanibaculum nanhaiense TaxID=1909734 RepID=UPI00396E7580
MKLAARGYVTLFRHHPRTLSFGFLHAFLSTPGQTFCIAIFVGAISADLGLNEATIGSIYLAATMGAAFLLPWLGQWIDRIDLRLFTALATAALALACLAMSAVEGPLTLIAAILLLRLCGQGLMVHIEATATARHFGENRGKALGLTAMGMPLAEAVMPLLITLLLAVWGWREAYAGIGVALLLVFLPLSQWLLSGQTAYTMAPARRQGAGRRSSLDGIRALIRSRFFWRALPALLYMPFTSTALVFHIGAIGEVRGWPLALIAQGFGLFAMSHALALFLSGPLVDRHGARSLMPWMIGPMAMGILAAMMSSHWLALMSLLASIGFSLGMAKTVMSAVWVEIFGIEIVGAIRSAAMTLMVAGTAAGPAVFGVARTAGLSLGTVLLLLVVYAIIAVICLVYAGRADGLYRERQNG